MASARNGHPEQAMKTSKLVHTERSGYGVYVLDQDNQVHYFFIS